MLKKYGENLSFGINQPDTGLLTAKEALADKEIATRFIKMAKNLKKIAPKAEDFLYGHAIMMHAAEAALIDQKTGEPLKRPNGSLVEGKFEPTKVRGFESVKWVSPDNIKPYKNANGDIFPEAELIAAHKKWVGKPLCKDHKSDSVDGIRGIVIDTYYDPKFKRVHALFALDRKNYADLARKVETGYANSVSMGTGVGRSVCTECANVARTEREFCEHIRARANYGEINLDLNPIELSLVVNGADGLAKIRNIVASMNNYVSKKQERISELMADRCVNPTELQALADSVADIQNRLNGLMKVAGDLGEETAATRTIMDLEEELSKVSDPKKRADLEEMIENLKNELKEAEIETVEEAESVEPIRPTAGGGQGYATMPKENMESGITGWPPFSPERRLASKNEEGEQGAISEISLLRDKVDLMIESFNELKTQFKNSKEENNMNSARLRRRAQKRRAYWQGGGGVNAPENLPYDKEDYKEVRDEEDKQMVGDPLETGSEGLHPGDKEVKERVQRASELEERRMKRRAYMQGGGGVNHPDVLPYPKEDAESIRHNEDKQMVEPDDMGGTDGLFPGDKDLKERIQRAKLTARFTKVADDQGNVIKDASTWQVLDKSNGEVLLSATAGEIFGDSLEESIDGDDQFNTNWDYLSSKEYGKDLLAHIRSEGLEKVAYLLKGAQEPGMDMAPPAPEAPAAPAEPAMPAEPEAPSVKVKEEKGEMQSKVDAALNDMEEKIAEIRELVAGSDDGELVDIDVNISDEGKGGAAPEAAPAPMDNLLASKKKVLEVEGLLNEAADELALISEALEKGKPEKALFSAASEALQDSKVVVAEADLILEAAKKKKDEDEAEDKAEDKKDEKKKKAEELLEEALKVRAQNREALLESLAYGMEDDGEDMGEDMDMDLDSGEVGKMKEDLEAISDMLKADDEEEEEEDDEEEDKKDKKDKDKKKDKDENDEEDEEDEEEDDSMDMMVGYVDEQGAYHAHDMAEDHNDDCGMAMDVDEEDHGADMNALASRKAKRQEALSKIADVLGNYQLDLGEAKGATEPTYFQAHPDGGTTTELSHTKTDGARVESLQEVHDKMLDVAKSGPRNVREAAATLNELVVEGKLKPEQIEGLVAAGKVDPAAAEYYKKYFGMAPDYKGNYGDELTKEFGEKKKEANLDVEKVKMRRAFDIALEAQKKGVIASTKVAFDKYVDDLMKLDDSGFESMKRVIAGVKAPSTGALPRVGSDPAQEPITATASVENSGPSLTEQLSILGWK